MTPSYEGCTAECGSGSYKRMKVLMLDHVEHKRPTMFQESADEVRRQLENMVHDVGERLADKTDEVFIQIKRDYRAVLGGGNVKQGEVLPRVHRQVRKEIKKTIDGVENMMKEVMGSDVDTDTKAEDDKADDETKMETKTKTEDTDVQASGFDNIKSEVRDQHTPPLPGTTISEDEDDEGVEDSRSDAQDN